MGVLRDSLISAGLDSEVKFQGLDIRVEVSVDGCTGCIFETIEKANGCNLKEACFAHMRKDSESVIFTNKQ